MWASWFTIHCTIWHLDVPGDWLFMLPLITLLALWTIACGGDTMALGALAAVTCWGVPILASAERGYKSERASKVRNLLQCNYTFLLVCPRVSWESSPCSITVTSITTTTFLSFTLLITNLLRVITVFLSILPSLIWERERVKILV